MQASRGFESHPIRRVCIVKTFTFTLSNDLKALEHAQTFQACQKTLLHLAERASIPHAHTFSIKAHRLPKTKTKKMQIIMHITASLGLKCIYSQEIFSFTYDHEHTLILHNEPTSGDHDSEFVEHIHIDKHSIDLKEIALQYVILGIPDYPHKTLPRDSEHQHTDTNKPFQDLAHLLQKKR